MKSTVIHKYPDILTCSQVGTKNEFYRDLAAPDFQEMSDWVTAINTASKANVIERSPFTVESMAKRRTTHVLLIRHGQYVTLSHKEPDTDKVLTSVGKQQAELTGKYLSHYLRERFVDERFPQMTIYHSDMTRAKETAQIIAESFPGAEMRQNSLLREAWPCNPLPLKKGQNHDAEVASMFADTSRLKVAFRTFFQHLCPNDVRRCSIQIPQEKVERFSATFDPQSTSVRIGDRYRIIVCHANIIRWFVCKVLGAEPEGTWGRMKYSHCGITEVNIDHAGNLQLGYLNQSAHLPPGLTTEQ